MTTLAKIVIGLVAGFVLATPYGRVRQYAAQVRQAKRRLTERLIIWLVGNRPVVANVEIVYPRPADGEDEVYWLYLHDHPGALVFRCYIVGESRRKRTEATR